MAVKVVEAKQMASEAPAEAWRRRTPLVHCLTVERRSGGQFAGMTRFDLHTNLKEKTRRIRSELLPKYPNLIREAKGKISPFSIRLFVSDRQEQVMQEVQALAMECFSPHNPAAWDRGWFESGASYDSNIGFQPPARAEYTDASWSEGIDDPISKID